MAAKAVALLLPLAMTGQLPSAGLPEPVEAYRAAAPDAAAQDQLLDVRKDRSDRMTVGVRINDSGPYPFIVDTGAERTVISSELAASLQLPSHGSAQLHTLSEQGPVQTVRIDRLAVSNAVVSDIRAPALARAHIGAAGILGIDSLQEQRVILDFRQGRMTILPSSRRIEKRESDEIVVRARSRFGRLLLADADVDGRKIYVILDTGAQVSIGNPVLAARLLNGRKQVQARAIDLLTVSGGRVVANYTLLQRVRIGGARLSNVPVAIADAHIFRQLDLQDRPALLLGMDVLRAFDRVSVDFANRTVRFLTRDVSGAPVPMQNADGTPAERNRQRRVS